MGQQQYSGQFPLVTNLSASANCGAGADDASVGTVAWSSPNQIASGNNTAASSTPAAQSHYLKATSFGFALPPAATIVGIELRVTHSTGHAPAGQDASVKLVKAGGITGNDRSAGVIWPSDPTVATFGSPTDLWGTTWTPSDINASNFGAVISANIFQSSVIAVNLMNITVYYTTQGGGQGIAIADSPVLATPDQWTAGATAILPVPSQPGLTTPWSITGWSLSYQGQLAQPAGPGVPSFGRLGELWCGLLFNTGGSTQGRPVPWVTPARPLPQDLSTFAKVWDGSSDPPFPWQAANAPPKSNGFSSQLPLPQKMQSGEQIAIGLWLQPALVQNVQALILNASYTIVYDDGLSAAPASITSSPS